MAIDKIIQELEIRTSAADKNLDDVIKRLNVLEKEFGDVEKKAKKGFKGSEKPVNNLNDTVKRLGQTIATVFAAEKIIQFTKSSIDAASDLNETISKTEQIFGDASKEVIAFAENAAEKLGQSKTQAMDAASTFATFGKSAGLSGTELANFSTDLVTLSADLASFNNTTPEEAIMAIGAALRGESEPIRRYGVLLDDASLRQEALALGIVKTTKQALTPQQKVLAAQAAIFKQTGDAQGDFARTSDGVANQQRILQATFQDLQAEIGQKLLPAFNKLLKGTVDFLKELDAEDVLDFVDAAAKAAAVFAAWKIGNAIAPIASFTKGLLASGNAMKFLNTAIKANPLGLLLSVATAVAAQFFDINDLLGETEKELTELEKTQQEYADAVQELNKNQTEQIGNTINLFDALRKTNKGSKDRKILIDEINKRYGTTLKNLEDEVEFQKQLDIAQDEVIKGIKEKIALQIQEKKYTSIIKRQAAAKAELKKNEDLLREATGKSALSMQEYANLLQETQFGPPDPEKLEILTFAGKISEAQSLISELDAEMKGLDVDTKDLIKSLGVTGDGDGPKGQPTLVGAFEALNKEASDLKGKLMEAIAQGNMADAKAYAASLAAVEGRLRNISSIAKGIMGELDFDISPEEEAQLNIAPDIDFEALAKEFDIPINKTKELIDVYDEAMAKQDEMFEKAMNQGKGFEEQKQQQISLESGLQEGMQRTSELTGALMTLAANRGGAYADFAKQLALANLAVNKAQAISAAIAGATAAAAAKGPGAPFLIAGYIASMIATVVSGFAEIDSIMNTPQPQPPQFFEGTDYLTRNGAPAGKDTIPAMLNEGEAIIPTADNAKYPGLAKSWINGDLDNYIYRNWVAPALSEAEAKKNESMADNLAKSIAMNMKGGFDDYRLYRTNRQGNSLLAQIADNTRPRMNKKRRYN